MNRYLSVLLVLVMLTVVACGQSTATPQPTAASAPPAAATAAPSSAPTAAATAGGAPTAAASAARKPEGAVVLAAPDFGAENWLPALAAIPDHAPVQTLYEYLVDFDVDSYQPIPRLAEKWEMSPDGLTWTFDLRKGVQFHDGWGEFTADDVQYNWDLVKRQDSKNALGAWARANVKSVETPNPYQVIFHMTSPNYGLLQRLTAATAFFGIASKKYVESVGTAKAAANPIGTGPYKFVEHKPGQHIKLEALDSHWRQVPYYKTLTIRLVPEEATRVAMLKSGEADLATVSPQLLPDIKKAGLGVLQLKNAISEQMFFGGMWSPEHPEYVANLPWVGPDPEKALKVRKAMALAINTQEIMDYVLGGVAQPISVMQFPPGAAHTDPNLKPYPYDPSQAKKLLAEAGYANGFDVTFEQWTARSATQKAVVEAVAAYWSQIGLRVNVVTLDQPTWFAKLGAAQSTNPFSYVGQLNDDPINTYLSLAHSSSKYALFETKQLDELVKKASTNMDVTTRTQQWKAVAQYVYDNYLHMPIAATSILYAATKKVGKWPTPLGAALTIPNLEYIAP